MWDPYNVVIFRKKVFDSERHIVFDECDFVSKTPEPFHEMYLNIEKWYTLGGIKWVVRVPDLTVTSNQLYEAIFDAMLHINSKGPEISRLKDWIASIKKK